MNGKYPKQKQKVRLTMSNQSEPPLPQFADQVSETLRHEIEQALAHLKQIKARMTQLEKAGMYPGVPKEQWQDRNALRNDEEPEKEREKNYLYMIFRQASGRTVQTYEGPEGKRKVYVGSDPRKIAEARQMAANRVEWDQLNQAASALESWLSQRRSELREQKRRASDWPRVWGLESAPAMAQRAPIETTET
jgi:hypothetical protein